MNHSNAHDHYNSLTAEQIIKDMNTCNDKLEVLTAGCGAIPYSSSPCRGLPSGA